MTGREGRGRTILLSLLLILLAWAGAVWLLQRSVLFPRYLANAHVPSRPNPPAGTEVWYHEIDGGRVEAWFIPGDGTGAGSSGPAVVFAHGNGELIDHWAEALAPYRGMGVSVLLPEYRGYGRSAGRPSQAGITRDMAAFVERLAARPEVDPDRIVYHGRSVGGGFAASLAGCHEPAAMILQSSFTGAASMARRFLVPPFLIRDPLAVLPVIRAFHGPILILHGEHDEVIPIAHAHRLHRTAPRSTLILYPMGHNDLPPWGRYWADIEAFLLKAGLLR